jgi:hypothetical protein
MRKLVGDIGSCWLPCWLCCICRPLHWLIKSYPEILAMHTHVALHNSGTSMVVVYGHWISALQSLQLHWQGQAAAAAGSPAFFCTQFTHGGKALPWMHLIDSTKDWKNSSWLDLSLWVPFAGATNCRDLTKSQVYSGLQCVSDFITKTCPINLGSLNFVRLTK